MFSTKEAKTFVESESKYLSAGIVDDVNIQEVKFGVSPNEKAEYISTTFVKNDSTVNMTVWKPKLFPGETEADLKNKYLKVLYRLNQIVEAFYPVGDPATECEANDFAQIAEWYIKAIEGRDKTKLTRTKFVYNKNGYLSVPTYAKYRFIEPMQKPENWPYSAVEIIDRDQIVRPITADPVKSSVNPFKVEETNTTTVESLDMQKSNVSDLPF